jgi:uncharacterized protein
MHTAALADVRVRRAALLHQGAVDGQRYAHNPNGWEAVGVLSPTAAAVLDRADGRALGDIARDLAQPFEALVAEVEFLARNGFIEGEGLPPPRRPKPSPPRFDLWVHVTNACDLDCPHCYIEKDGRSLDEARAQTLLDALVRTAREGVRAVHLRFAGGEPMLRFDLVRRFYDDAREALAREGCALTAAVLTNGTHTPDEALAWMRDRRVSVSLSIDGVGSAHDAMRPRVGGGGSFALVEAGVARYRDAGIDPFALVTVSRQNLAAMPALTDWLLARRMGFRYSLVRDLEGGDSLLEARSAGWRALPGLVQLRRSVTRTSAAPAMLEGEALARVLAVFDDCYARIERAMPVAPSFRRTHRFCDLEWKRPIRKACGAGEGSLAIGHDGAVSPCQAALHHPGTSTLTADRSLAALAPTVNQLGDFRRHGPGDGCASCEFRRSCAGGCPLMLYRRDGRVDGRSPYCEVFRAVLPRIVRLVALELMHEQRARHLRG